jgi:hypothetical protein
MRLVKSNGTVRAGFPFGQLLPGDYILSVNASYGRSYTSNYYGIKQIASANYSTGSIKIALGSPSVQTESFGRTTSSGYAGATLARLETLSLNLSSSNAVRNVNLSSISVIDGTWVRFIPSYFSTIGPVGVPAKMLLAGSGEPAVKNDISNVSMIIQTKANGAVLGEMALPLEMDGTSGSAVLHSLAPVQEFLSGAWNLFSANQQIFGVETIILDETTNSTSAFPVAVSIAGLYEANGSLGPQPPWLRFTLPQSSSNLTISPSNPLDFQLNVDTTSDAPLGVYTVVVAFQIADEEFALLIPVEVGPPIST